MTAQIVEHQNIWGDDVLGRAEDVNYLQSYLVKRYSAKKNEPGFVLAINAEWGFGKTFMLDRWRRQIIFEGHPAVYFDAWKNDFTEDPLLAFISELDSGLKEYFKNVPIAGKVKATALAKAKRLWKPIITVLGCAAVKHLAGVTSSQVKDFISSTTEDDDSECEKNDEDENRDAGEKGGSIDFKEVQDNLKKTIEKALSEHATVKKSIVDFKTKLGALIEALAKVSGVQLPLIVFVDELDRCRPDYAIELLEGIKHLFGVPGVFFVVATNIRQLGESVKAIYGNGFDGQRYLNRFFDLQYTLREPSNRQFAKSLFSEMACPELPNIIYGLEHQTTMSGEKIVDENSEDVMIFVFEKFADVFDLTLRDQLQIAIILEAALLSLRGKVVHIYFLIFLSALYHWDVTCYLQISKTKSMDAFNGLKGVSLMRKKGLISFRSENYQGNSLVKNEGVIHIVENYFAAMQTSVKVKNERVASRLDFPANLLNDLQGKKENGEFVADYYGYFELIQHAGGFSQ
jgi:hypothetical protein